MNHHISSLRETLRPEKGGCYGSSDLKIVEPRGSQRPCSEDRPVDPAGTVENAKSAFPTVPWTAHTPRRPQAPQARRLLAIYMWESV